MCWSVTTSLVTFGVGSVFNLLSHRHLRRQNSIAAPMLAYWQFTLLMQLPEAAAWVGLNGGNEIPFASRTAMLLNVLQPVALLMTVLAGYERRADGAIAAVFMYAVLMLSDVVPVWNESASIAPLDQCEHLNLGYWDGSRTLLYVAASLVAFRAIPDVFWALVNGGIFLVTLVVSAALYPCGGGSMWCWMIFVAGPILSACECVRRSCEPKRNADEASCGAAPAQSA